VEQTDFKPGQAYVKDWMMRLKIDRERASGEVMCARWDESEGQWTGWHNWV